LASLLLKQTRESDIVARIGGEEFVILLPNTSKDSANKFANKLRDLVEKKEMSIDENESILFTVSIGISELDIENEEQIEESLARADKALYMAKNNGRNRVC
jgi:diguanylate cyclase (GGDEF)-like protein